jgi:pyruvate,water dikinase
MDGTMTALILPLSDLGATLELVGGKGMSLAKLGRAGLPVPNGFHVTTEAYRRFVSENNLQEDIRTAMQAVDVAKPNTFEAASQRIGVAFARAKMSATLAEAIQQAYSQLAGKDPAVAVRSSATAEDLPEASFAGQQETYLNVCGQAAVLDAVQHCWGSLWTGRAIAYRSRQKIAPQAVALAVVVQVLVPAEAAGVLFTANPLNGRRNELVINAAWGLGEAVVSGAVTPDTLTVDKVTQRLVQRVTAGKQVMTIRAETGTREQSVPVAKQDAPVLSDGQALELARFGCQIEALYGAPMDIEWAMQGGNVAILQARPITALPENQPEPIQEWKLPDPKGLYMRASLIEQLPEPLTPLFATLGGEIADAATRRLFAWMTGAKEMKPGVFTTINGYGYLRVNFGTWNTVMVALSQLVRMNSIFKQSESRWHQAHDRYAGVIRHWQTKPASSYTTVELLQGVRALTTETMEMYTVLQIGPIATALASETIFTQLYSRLIRKKGDPEAQVFVMGFESAPIRAELALYDLAEWVRGRPGLAAHLEAAAADQLAGELERADPPAGVPSLEWDEWRRRFQEHLVRFGHFTYDLDFSKAVAADAPAPLLETCRMYLLGKAGSPYARVKALVDRREQATRTVMARLHAPMRRLFRQQMQSAQKYAPLREDGLSDLGLGYPLLRKLLYELGKRFVRSGVLEQPEDVFWLSGQEGSEAAEALDQGRSSPPMQAAVLDRRAIWRIEQRLSPPVVLPVGSKYYGMNVEKLTSGGLTEDPRVIKGFGSSQGRVTATARVLLGPEDFDQLQPGDVLVAPLTTPAWTPLFALASAIVTDIGGPLSHSSIVAREYGLPAVLGTGVATRRIHSGQTITVDGGAGTVTVES